MHIVIVEDEPVIAQRLQRQVAEILSCQQPKIKWFDDFDDAESYLSEQTPDLLLLDLNLHGSDGFDLLKQLSAESFQTIIVSAYAEKAITAFEFGVLDFVAKPFTFERLQQAILRFTESNRFAANAAKQLAVKKTSGLELVRVDELVFVKADGHYTELHTQDDKSHLHDKPIDKLEKLLPENFCRIHRSYLVDLSQARKIHIASGGSYQLELTSGQELPISRGRYPRVRERMGL